MSMVKALTQIVTVEKEDSLISMSVVEKQNESGIKFNERLFVVLHGQFFGYISQAKMTQDPNQVDVETAKVKVPMKNLHTVETEQDIIRIRFTTLIEGKLSPKEWILRVASQKMANFWKELLQYQIQLRKENEKKKEQLRRSNSGQKNPPSLSKLRQGSGFGKNVERNSQQDSNKKEETFNELFDSAGTDPDEKKKKTQEAKQEDKKARQRTTEKKMTEESPKKSQKSLNSSQSSRKSLSPGKSLTVSIPDGSSGEQKRDHQNPVHHPTNAQREKALEKSKNLPKIEEEDSYAETPHDDGHAKGNFKIVAKPFERTGNKSSKSGVSRLSSLEEGEREIEYMDSILARMEEKNRRTPISQISYDHAQVAEIIRIYGKGAPRSPSSKMEMILNSIIQAQKSRLQLTHSQKGHRTHEKSWFFEQIAKQEGKVVAMFGEECTRLTKELHQELESKEWKQFTKQKVEGNILYLKKGDIEVKVGMIGVSDSPSGKVLDRSGQKKIKREFRACQYLYSILHSRSKIKMPFHCLCEYAGITALFRIKVEEVLQTSNKPDCSRQLLQMELETNLPFSKSLPSKIKTVNAYHYNEMKTGTVNANFDLLFIEDTQGVMPSDMGKEVRPGLLRMELLREHNVGILPHVRENSQEHGDEYQPLRQMSLKVDEQLKKVVKLIDNLEFTFICPSELTSFLHSNGISMKYIGKLYRRLTNSYPRSLLLSEIAARTAKNILNSSLQEQLFDPNSVRESSSDSSSDLLKHKVVDFLNCLLGRGQEANALWSLVWRNIQEQYRIADGRLEDLDKGQLLVSVAYHCHIKLDWELISADKVFGEQDMLLAGQLKDIVCSSKTFVPRSAVVPVVLEQKIQKVTQDTFKWVVENLDLKKQSIPGYLTFSFPELVNQLRYYLTHFVQDDSMDWNNSYAHLGIYDTSQPTKWNFLIEINSAERSLNRNQKARYLAKFSEISGRVSRLFGSNHPCLSKLYEVYALHHGLKGQVEDATNFYKSSILNLTTLGATNSYPIAHTYYQLACLLLKHRREAEALDYLKSALQIMSRYETAVTLTAQIAYHLATIYYKQANYQLAQQSASQARLHFEKYESEPSESNFEKQRITCYEIEYQCHTRLDNSTESGTIVAHLQGKLEFFKSHTCFQQAYWMVIHRQITLLNEENQQSLARLVHALPVKRVINMYHKAGKLIRVRLRQNNLVGLVKNYLGNAAKIVSLVEQNSMLEGWKPLATSYERESLFDFISCIEETLYLVGKDRLSSALPSPS